MRKISLKKALELFGGKNIEVHKGYQYRYGFFDKDNQCYYFNTNVNGFGIRCGTLIRTARDRKDYTGGANTYPLESFLEERGYKLDVPACNCDFNSN